MGRGKSLALGMDYAATAYAEDVLDLDGVWWNDELDVSAYSAPRGVIFASKMGAWTATRIPEGSEGKG